MGIIVNGAPNAFIALLLGGEVVGTVAGLALRLAAQGCHHAKNALGAFYRRIQGRAGGPKAVVATARKIATRVYRLLKYGTDYVRQEMAAYEEAYRLRVIKSLARTTRRLGYQLVPTPP